MKVLAWLAHLLASVGAINWGLVTFFKFNFVDYLNKLSGNIGIDMFLYALVALAGIYSLISLFIS
ncbi:DUF378 domain-containing protein [Candidatus Babeliales bacterium]|nr:DUF378 domain-containing protein [Candidatus Babeliales bacterium]